MSLRNRPPSQPNIVAGLGATSGRVGTKETEVAKKLLPYSSTEAKIISTTRRNRLFCVFCFFLVSFWCIYWLNYSFCDTRSHLQFIHIPKTGGTTITREGYGRGYLWGVIHFQVCRFSPFQGVKIRKCIDPDGMQTGRSHHIPPRDHTCKKYFSKTFCVVRNPYTRMLSEFRFRTSPGSAWCRPNRMNQMVRSWLHAYRSGKRSMNYWHLVPQSEYIMDENEARTCTHIIRNEGMNSEFNALMKQYNIDIRLGDENPGPSFIFGAISSSIEWFMDRSVKKIGDRHNVQKSCPLLTTADFDLQTISLIQSVYANDFSKLGYSKQLPQP